MLKARYSICFLWQVAAALICLRQRNNHPGSLPFEWPGPVTNFVDPGVLGTFDHCTSQSQESEFFVNEIIESSKTKARTMVDAAVQVHSQSAVIYVGIFSKSSSTVTQIGFKMMMLKRAMIHNMSIFISFFGKLIRMVARLSCS